MTSTNRSGAFWGVWKALDIIKIKELGIRIPETSQYWNGIQTNDNHAAFCYSDNGTVWYSNPYCTLSIQLFKLTVNTAQVQLIVKCVNNTKLDPTEIYFFNLTFIF